MSAAGGLSSDETPRGPATWPPHGFTEASLPVIHSFLPGIAVEQGHGQLGPAGEIAAQSDAKLRPGDQILSVNVSRQWSR